jgi:hypothetical protein
MKSSTLLRMTLGLAGLSAALLAAPASRAQADVAPDHFDGTDSWAAAAPAKSAAKPTAPTASARAPKRAQVQPVSERTVVNPRRTGNKQRKSTTPKSK